MHNITLSNGIKMPMIGYGVLQNKDIVECEHYVYEAIKSGCRYIDTASAYHNEEAVGRAIQKAIKENLITREEIFVSSKLWVQDTNYESALQAYQTSLKKLSLSYLDLYLIHHPLSDYYDAWRALEHLYNTKQVRAIGVCNFDEARLADLCLNATIAPMVNQVEMHPFYQQDEMIQNVKEYPVILQAWAPLSEGLKDIFHHKLLKSIANKHKKSVAQVVLRWNLQREIPIVFGSKNIEHIKEDLEILDFTLTPQEMENITTLDLGYSEILDLHNACNTKWLNNYKIHD